jgi:hypothetical protein
MKRALIVLVCFAGSPMIVFGQEAGSYSSNGSGVNFLGNLADKTLTETSGMVLSGRNENLLWIINDSGNPPMIHAVGLDGSSRGQVRLRKAKNRDWEDLAAFQFNGESYLLIADCGDNDRIRKSSFLYAVVEPEMSSAELPEGSSVPWNWRIKFSYIDGPRDCEGVAVDMSSQQILLLTKRTVPPVIYALPLVPVEDKTIHLARPVATLYGIPAPTPEDLREDPLYGRFRSQPTAMDISPNGKTIAVLTYRQPYLYLRHGNESWPETFNRPPRALSMPRMKQAEAICFNSDGTSLFVTSEKRPAPLYRLDIRP